MQRVSLLVLDDELLPTLGRLGELGALQVIDAPSLKGWPDGIRRPDVDRLVAEYERLSDQMRRVVGTLGLTISPDLLRPATLAPQQMVAQVEADLSELDGEVQRLLDERSAIADQLERLEVVVLQLELLEPLDIDLAELRTLRFLYVTAGLLPVENLSRLEQSLSEVPHLLLRLGRSERRWRVIVFAPRTRQQAVDAALRGAFLERTEIPNDVSGLPSAALQQLHERQRLLLAERESIGKKLTDLAKERHAELLRLASSIETNRRAVTALRDCLSTERARAIVGWVPEAQADRLLSDVHGRVATLAWYAEGVPTLRASEIAPLAPTKLSNPAWLHQFEPLTSTYGLPTYWEVDPTPIAAALFLLMFGAMFGDLGQGAILALLGLIAGRWSALHAWRALGPILVGCGISAMVFGLIYGSVFGSEDLIPALVVRPLEHISLLLGIAVGYGVVVMSVGFLLNIINAGLRHNLRSVLFAPYGLAGLGFYWIAVGLAISVGLGHVAGVTIGVVLLIIPLLLMFLKEPLDNLLGGKSLSPAEGPVYFLQSGVEVFDAAIRYLSNTLSFVRVGAFAITHVGLGLTVFTLAAMLAQVPLGRPVVLILGNALIIGLEGLIVGIQALRLEYYEFFGKFFRGDGVPYRPLVLPGFLHDGKP
ncbi:MAG: hypothetical protein EPO21_14720 [Chloroflexota bacterium]|nr:MAG: hypothetical protein EPO21_14720 [Chloroflexota bacterium]